MGGRGQVGDPSHGRRDRGGSTSGPTTGEVGVVLDRTDGVKVVEDHRDSWVLRRIGDGTKGTYLKVDGVDTGGLWDRPVNAGSATEPRVLHDHPALLFLCRCPVVATEHQVRTCEVRRVQVGLFRVLSWYFFECCRVLVVGQWGIHCRKLLCTVKSQGILRRPFSLYSGDEHTSRARSTVSNGYDRPTTRSLRAPSPERTLPEKIRSCVGILHP